MEDDIIELSDSGSESRLPQQESKEISLLNSKLAELSAALTAKSELLMEQGKELNKLRKENGHLKNERDMQNAEIAGLQDELKNILQQLDDHTVRASFPREATHLNHIIAKVKNLKLGLIKLDNSDHGVCEHVSLRVMMLIFLASFVGLPSEVHGIKTMSKTYLSLTTLRPALPCAKMSLLKRDHHNSSLRMPHLLDLMLQSNKSLKKLLWLSSRKRCPI
jgi:hypothetical protein